MNEVVYYGIRAWLAVSGWCCPRKKSTYVPPSASTLEVHEQFTIETIDYGDGVKKRVVHPAGSSPLPSVPQFMPHPPPPWFFIGCYDSAESLQDKTYEMEEYVYPGNVISTHLLKHLFPGTRRWVYIHPETFEETDFPSEGIVIAREEDD